MNEQPIACNPKNLVQRICDEEYGLLPTNFQIKPVHVANGLVRALTGRSYDASPLSHTLRRWVLNQTTGVQEERFPNRFVLDRYGRAFEGRNGLSPDEEALNDFRQLAHGALGADSGVWGDADHSSFTLANERFVTADTSDNRAGLFLARLLVAGGDGEAARLMRDLVTSENDPWTTLALPLLQLSEPREATLKERQAAYAARSDPLFVTYAGELCSPVLRRLRQAYDRLARSERGKGSKVNSLRRMVLFGCFATHVHMLNRWSEAMPGAPCPPIFPDMLDGTRAAIVDASRATVRAAGDCLEGLLAQRISEYVQRAGGEPALLGEVPSKDRDRIGERLRVYRGEARAAAGNPICDALLDLALEDIRGHPVNFLTELGRRSGYMVPWSNLGRGGRLQKRYSFTAEFLETLVGAVVEPDNPLDFREFLECLHDIFGVAIGRPEDDEVIRRNNLGAAPFGSPISISEDDLRANVEGLRQLVIETGYAKAYADGQTIVAGDPEGFVVQ